ncbi:hypothetical protein AB0G02_35930, partial [Actinosynnema sp. NPDC023658]
ALAGPATASYVVAELPGLNGFPRHYPTDVNDLGQVVGSAQGDGVVHAVLWSPRGGVADLGPGLAGAINQSGRVLGLESAGVQNSTRMWTWSGGERQPITPPGAAWALAQVINDSGAVPMSYSMSASTSAQQRAAVWDGAQHVTLPVAGDYVGMSAINDAGVVAGGYASFAGQEFAGVRCDGGTCTELAPGPGYGPYGVEAVNGAGVVVANRGMVALRWEDDELGVLSETGRLAHGKQSLNERGDAVGWVLDDGTPRAVLWPAGGKQVDLDVPAPSEAIAINERGDVVGYTSTPDRSVTRVFLWHAGEVTYLDSLGGSYSMPVAINDHGVVVGQSTTADGTEKAARWTPVTTTLVR